MRAGGRDDQAQGQHASLRTAERSVQRGAVEVVEAGEVFEDEVAEQLDAQR